MKSVLHFSFLVFIAYLVTACGVSNDMDTNSTTKFPEGRSLYVSKCTACHRAYEPELHTKVEWQKLLDEMAVKAKLTDDEKQKILDYLTEIN